MAQVQAWQHIYTSVEREQSPRGLGGFQTLFYSQSGLTEAEVKEMEARLVYFPAEREAVKHVFATLSTGKVMVAQIVHLTEPDRLGRKGRYLAHNLVFEPPIFAQIESDPFVVFRRFPFITTVAEALERGELQTGDIPPVSFEAAPEPAHGIEAAGRWPTPVLRDLALLALRAERLAGERTGLAFVGEPCAVLEALEAAFLAVPAPLRLHCSFDTYFHRCNPVSTYYWAVGLLEAPVGHRFVTVDTRSRQLGRPTEGQPQTAYERWAMTLVEGRQLEAIGRYRGHAFAICRWLEGQACVSPPSDDIPSEVMDSVFRSNRELAEALLYRKLGETLPPILAQRAFQYLNSHLESGEKPVLLPSVGGSKNGFFGLLRTRFDFPELAEALYRAYESQGFCAPRTEEIQALDWLLRRADHAFLRLLHVCWTDRRDVLAIELQLLGEDEYRQFVQTALRFNLIEPEALPVPGRGNAFLDVYLALDGPAKHDLADLTRALLEVGEGTCLARLTPHVQGQPEHDLRALAQIVTQRPGIPESFRHAVTKAVEALPLRKTGLWATWFGRGRAE